MARIKREGPGKRSIFHAIFVPLFLIMVIQSAIFFLAAVYGGVEHSLRSNAAEMLRERLLTQRNQIEAQLTDRCFDLSACSEWLQERYTQYEEEYGDKPLAENPQRQIRFLGDCADPLIAVLRQNEVNGIFLILNDKAERTAFTDGEAEKKYGICIRDIDQESNYTGREDLLLERSPSSIVEQIACPLDSWWEAWYTFDSEAQGDYYYCPLNAAWDNPRARGVDLAYFAGVHHLSASDHAVVSYSVPLIDDSGYPYGVFGVELTTRYLASLMPNNGLDDISKPCYVLAQRQSGEGVCEPIVGAGALYTRSFGSGSAIACDNTTDMGGFTVVGRGDSLLYGDAAELTIYNNNNPFEARELVLLALADNAAVFSHINRVKLSLMLASLFCLALGLAAILVVSRNFAAPITALVGRVRELQPQDGFDLGQLGIAEIDQLVESIETLNRDVSRSSARTEFFSRMSHDMRTPMNAIISFSSPEMLEGADEAVKDDYLSKINASGTYLLGLINEVLDMTKIESDKVGLRLDPIQASELFTTTIPIIGKLAAKKGITFTSDIEVGDGVCVLADAQHMNQVVMNLLSNAVKFAREGGNVNLKIRLTPDGASPDIMRCIICVSDDGIGMSDRFMERMFVPFEQESDMHEGTGLGLPIAKKLVDLMNGDIRCESKKGVGTTFTVDLPLTRCDEVLPQIQQSLADIESLAKLRGKRVLLCEDNAMNILIVCHLLEKLGISVDVAKDGLSGANMYAASAPDQYDAILMDVRMPVMDGLAATRMIRAMQRPDAATVPIIAMTANAFTEDVTASKAAGMDEHLAKPLEVKKFFEILTRFLVQ